MLRVAAAQLTVSCCTVGAARPRPLQEVYPVFWAVGGNQSAAFGSDGSVNVGQYGIKPNNWTQCGGLTGHWPTLGADMVAVNGGVPQNVNLTDFLARLGAQINSRIPDPEWNGLGSFDFEEWTPIWEENDGWAGKIVLGKYQNYSVQLVRAAHPSWPADRVLQQARSEFEAAAMALFVAALKHASALRPRALWGFYGMPRGNVGPRNATNALAVALAAARKMLPVWQASGALYPSIYLGDAPSPESTRAQRLNTTVAVAVAAAEMVCEAEGAADNRRMPVYPFAWECYEHYFARNDSRRAFLRHTDAVMELLSPYNAGANGLVIWGATVEAQGGENWDAYTHYIRSSTGPLVDSYQRKAHECSVSHCSGHGRCRTVDPDPSNEVDAISPPQRDPSTAVVPPHVGVVLGDAGGPGQCECFYGYVGATCATTQ